LTIKLLEKIVGIEFNTAFHYFLACNPVSEVFLDDRTLLSTYYEE